MEPIGTESEESEDESPVIHKLDQALERATADNLEGRVLPHKEVRRKYDKWL